MKLRFSTYADRWRPLSVLALGLGMVVPLPVVAASQADARPGVTKAASPGPARLVEGDTAAKAGLIPGFEGEGRGRFSLVTGAGLVFHRTDAAVRGLRTVDVPDSAVQLYTWQEEDATGRRQDFFAYSRGGAELMGRVQPTSYVVRLAHQQFDPVRGAMPLVTGLLSEDPDNRLKLVQFQGTPLPEFRAAIEASGGKVLRFLADHTFLVEMDAQAQKRVAELPYVRWVGGYHPEYRVEEPLREAMLGRSARLEAQRYSIMVGEHGAARQNEVADLVRKLGGKVDLIEPGGWRVEATLTQPQLERLVRSNAVQFVDRWGGPGEVDMNNVRAVGGAAALETLRGWTGQGVRGEIFDTELRTTHQEWATPPIIHSTSSTGSAHGTSCYSINFARGVDATARGLLPSGQGIFYLYSQSTQFGGTKSRYDINKELIDPAGPYRAVFQTSSVGSTLTTAYTTISAEVDDYLLKHPILSTQSQSNNGTRNSRPQAWAKNIVSVGGFYHYDNSSRTDDRWNGGASIGPAADGRIKPDLSYFYDAVRSANNSSNTSYYNFSGTSAATPQTAGYFGLLFQMWHNGVWAGFGGGADVFASRPQMATAKALMINMAYRYNWLAGGANGDLDRNKQGWGTADVKRLHDRAAVTSIVNETDVLTPLARKTYRVNVATGETELNVTMVYNDPAGTVGAAQARINDLSLKVTSPSGVVYWGNNGLTAGNTSTSGGVSNKVDTVENVFLQNPAAGTWTVEVIADELVQDARLETTAIDADYGLVVSGGKFI
ncbi:S8 family serine peptidase [Pyxidicoccus fallax]|uniref:S8 family serine peptidase n=1 Tax=Pyxidicoccus fallax TaxID=394095 RepID=A0A848LU73_9BACT|nr:S8 family serine peptidase [Pyxidicoccus fallax]NMO21568.1 S8 family serine peptidase [Pyxidicoccus fallax]NPC82791.1 S8 family serine peptidase [Pyxidicoccus fallax]